MFLMSHKGNIHVLKVKVMFLYSSEAKAECYKPHCIKFIPLLRNKLCHINKISTSHNQQICDELHHIEKEQNKNENSENFSLSYAVSPILPTLIFLAKAKGVF